MKYRIVEKTELMDGVLARAWWVIEEHRYAFGWRVRREMHYINHYGGSDEWWEDITYPSLEDAKDAMQKLMYPPHVAVVTHSSRVVFYDDEVKNVTKIT